MTHLYMVGQLLSYVFLLSYLNTFGSSLDNNYFARTSKFLSISLRMINNISLHTFYNQSSIHENKRVSAMCFSPRNPKSFSFCLLATRSEHYTFST